MKAVALLLVVLNAALYAWWQGHLSPLWEPPGAGEREPARLTRQMRAETVTVLGSPTRARPGTGAAPANAAASAPPHGAAENAFGTAPPR
jgi:hypothetical protein